MNRSPLVVAMSLSAATGTRPGHRVVVSFRPQHALGDELRHQ